MANQQQYCFEIYLLNDIVTAGQWTKLYLAMLQFAGRLSKFRFVFSCEDNVVRYFLVCSRNVSSLSNSLDGIVLRPTRVEELPLPQTVQRLSGFTQFVSGGTLLDLKEKLAVKKGLELGWAYFDVRTVNSTYAVTDSKMFIKDAVGNWRYINKTMYFFPANLFALNLQTNTRYLKKAMPLYLNIEKSLHMLTSQTLGSVFEIDSFPYAPQNYYLGLTDYEFDKHSFIIGATGSGKSKLISLYVDRLYKTMLRHNYRIVIIDPHASLAADFSHLSDKKIINFSSESTSLFPEQYADISAATELTTTLFGSLLAAQYTPRLERLLRFSLFVLFTAQNMSLDMLKRFLSEIELRSQIVAHVQGYVPDTIIRFFGADFNELRTTYYNEAIAPLVALVDEMQLQPALVAGGDVPLARTIQENFLTVFSLNKVSMGEKATKTVAGLLIQQVFLLAQARAMQQKIILIVDEVAVIQNPALAAMLAEARKFGLTVVLSQQYFGQIEKSLQDAIFSNVYNYYVFRTSEEDARRLEGNLHIEIPAEILESHTKKGLSESDIRVRMLTELSPRECMLRLYAGGKLNPCVKAQTLDAPVLATVQPTIEQPAQTMAQARMPQKFQEEVSASVLSRGTYVTADPPPEHIPPQSVYDETVGHNLQDVLAAQSSKRTNLKDKLE
ncbi:MAG: type IV secretion system DNA-binding domain-containing protein [Candidatus Doudnabacteria bacterium]|nr:type IV secretion system DNA-binding domain-containing protein [Candidatus Doudnabacteria bacterium]